MGVTIVRCANEECGKLLNGELCFWAGKKPFCGDSLAGINEHDEEDIYAKKEAEDSHALAYF